MRKRFHFLITLPVFLILGCVVLFLLLPTLLDRYLFPQLIQQLPFSEQQLSLSRLSPWTIRGTLTLADEDRTTLSVPKFELSYSPESLLKRKVTGILLDSASLQLEIQDGRLVIRGLPAGEAAVSKEGNTSSFLLPLEVETIMLKNCSITLYREEQQPIKIIVNSRISLDFSEKPGNKKLLSALSGEIQLGGDLTLQGEFGLQIIDNETRVDLQFEAPRIEQALKLAPESLDIDLKGALSFTGQANFDQATSQVTGYEAQLTVAGFSVNNNGLMVKSSAEDKPLTLLLTGGMEKADYNLTNISLSEPEKLDFGIQGEWQFGTGTFSGVGRIFSERTNSSMTLNYQGHRQQTRTDINFDLAAEAFELEKNISFRAFKSGGNITIEDDIIAGKINGLLPRVDFKKQKIRLVNLSLNTPFQFPSTHTGPSGKLKIGRIRYQKVNSGRFITSFQQSPEGFTFNSLFTTPFAPGLKLTCDGAAQLSTDVSAHCRFKETRVDSINLPGFIPLPDDLFFNGRLAATGEFQLRNKVPKGKATFQFKQGSLTQGENKLSDINLGITLPHLPLMASSSGQLCTIGSLTFGKIKLSDARLRFRIEDQQSIFLEKMQASWVGGKVETGGFSLAANMEELETTLYCDRLGFTELLAQFGIQNADGQGSLNGKLPVHISKKGLVFDDGFLFSTPGNSGIVRFNDTTQLRQGIPDINRSAYLDYSMKALENFSYNWTKLSFNSIEDDLLIAMQLDGKPAEPLPFGYQNGHIVPTNSGPGLQHPIRLDVNFHLPLQDLFQYGKNIQSIMENM